MKVVCFYIILFLSTTTYFSQNLILNPSFEDSIDNCTYHIDNNTFLSSIPYARHWFVPTYSTPDLHNENSPFCHQFGYNLFGMGSSLPQEGSTYIGFISYAPADGPSYSREYIAGKLSDTLKTDKNYCLVFHLKLANISHFAHNKIGFYFSPDSIGPGPWPWEPDSTYPTFNLLTYQPQVEFEEVLDDTVWSQYTATFKADGGEKYFYIGVFQPDDSLTTATFGSTSSPSAVTYYLLDNLSLTLCPGQENPPPPIHHSIYPNPSNGGQFTVEVYDEEAVEVLVHNEIGQLIYYELLPEGATQKSIQLQLASGVYLVSFCRGGVRVKTEKVVILR